MQTGVWRREKGTYQNTKTKHGYKISAVVALIGGVQSEFQCIIIHHTSGPVHRCNRTGVRGTAPVLLAPRGNMTPTPCAQSFSIQGIPHRGFQFWNIINYNLPLVQRDIGSRGCTAPANDWSGIPSASQAGRSFCVLTPRGFWFIGSWWVIFVVQDLCSVFFS